MKKSIGLLSALVVSTTFIVNCQKAPDKRRVRPSGGSGAATDVVGEKTKLPTKVCSKELATEFSTFAALYKKATSTHATATSNAEELKAMQADLVNTLAKCDTLIPQFTALGESENFGCLKDAGVKSEANSLTKAQVQQWCNYTGAMLEKEHSHPNAYSTAFKDAKKAEANTKEIEAKFLGKEFKVSEEALNMMYEGHTNLASFLVEGEVKSDKNQATTASQTVCTTIAGIAKDQVFTSPVLEFTEFAKAEKSAFKDISVEYNDKATLISFTLKEAQTEENESNESTTTPGALLCLNLPFEKLSVAQLETVFGKAITVAPEKVKTEVKATEEKKEEKATETKETKETKATDKLAAAQPEGSPQQAQLEVAMAPTVKKETEQKAADEKAAQEKAAADKKAADEKAAKEQQAKKAKEEADAKAAAEAKKEEEKPVITVAPAAAASSPAAAAKVETAKVTKEELASMKEKAERLDKEATAAEAEVTKLESEKAKADDVDQAKAKARIARESANDAKAEYEAAAKQA